MQLNPLQGKSSARGSEKVAADTARQVFPTPHLRRTRPEVIEALRDVPHYDGPADGLSHPSHARLVDGALRALIPLLYRVNLHVEAPDALPVAGQGTVVAYDHPSTVDPLLTVATLHKLNYNDVRSMAMASLFVGPVGPLVTWAGAFPVNRKHPGPVPMDHSVDVVRNGGTVSVAPSGTTRGSADVIGPFHPGPASIAVKGGAEKIIPITFHYHPTQEATAASKRAGALGAAAGVVATVAAVAVGGAALPVVGIAGATLAGAYLGGKLAQDRVHAGHQLVAGAKLGAKLLGGLLGASATAAVVAALLPAAPVVGVVAGLAGAAAWAGLARGWGRRDVANVVVGTPLDVPSAVEAAEASHADGRKAELAAVEALTVALHTQIGETKAELTGTPFDTSKPAIVSSRTNRELIDNRIP